MVRHVAHRAVSLAGIVLWAVWGAQSCRFPEETIDCSAAEDCTDEGDGLCDPELARCTYPDESCRGSLRHYGRYSTGRGACVPGTDGGAIGSGGTSGSGGRAGSGGAGSGAMPGGGDASIDGGEPTTRVDGGAPGPILELVAGRIGGWGSSDGVGSGARFLGPSGIAYDGKRYLYVADSGSTTIRRVDSETAEVVTIAGDFDSTEITDGKGTEATFDDPSGLLFDGSAPAAPALYVSEFSGGRIRKIDLSTSMVSTLVGNPAGESGLKDGVGPEVRLGEPDDMVFGAGTTLYFADAGNNVVRTLDTATKRVTTIAGDAVDGTSGSTDGAAATARFAHPHGLAYDGANQRLFIGEYGGNRIRVLDLKTSMVSTLVPSVEGPASMLYDATLDRLLVVSSGLGRVLDVDVKQKTYAALVTKPGPGFEVGQSGTDLTSPLGIASSSASTLFVVDEGGATVRKMTASGTQGYEVVDFVGAVEHSGHTDATGDAARFDIGGEMVLSDDGASAYTLDLGNHVVRKVELATGKVSTYAGNGTGATTDGVGKAAQFDGPMAMSRGAPVTGKAAVLYVSQSNGAVRSIDTATAAVKTLFAGGAPITGWVEGIAATTTTIYVSDSIGHGIYQLPLVGGTPTLLAGAAEGGCVDGAFATARFSEPNGILWDGGTKLLVSDPECRSIRRIDLTAKTVETVAGDGEVGRRDGKGKAARFLSPSSISYDRERTGFYVGDEYLVRFVDATTFQVTTVIGDSESQAGVRLSPGAPQLNFVQGLLEGPAGALYVFSENALLRYTRAP
jgi:hypothetical protein